MIFFLFNLETNCLTTFYSDPVLQSHIKSFELETIMTVVYGPQLLTDSFREKTYRVLLLLHIRWQLDNIVHQFLVGNR